MSSFQSAIEILLFVLAIVVFLLQLFAHFNLNNEYKNKEKHSLNMFWLFHDEIYNEYGKSASRLAKKIFYFAVILGVIWAIIFIVKVL